MDDKNKALSMQIMEALKPILPNGTGFIMVFGKASEEEIGICSNLPDPLAVGFLEAALEAVEETPGENLNEPERILN